MARRSEHTREELVEMAIQAGDAIIEERGFQAFSARAVAARMGYTVGTLYHLFGTLDNFILHINARTLDQWFEAIRQDAPKKQGDRLRYLAQSYLTYAEKHQNRWAALFEHRLPPGTPVPDWYAPKMARLFELVEEAVMPLAKNDQKKARRMAKVIWASIHGICTLALTGKLAEVKATAGERMIDDLLAMVAGKALSA